MAEKPSNDRSWTEPESNFDAKYPFNNVTYTESGHFTEFDDTPGAERIRTQHRSGTYTEIQANGTEVHKIIGEGYEIVANNKYVLVKGACNITIQGDSYLKIEGDAYSSVDGNLYQRVLGDANIVSEGDLNITSVGGDIDITSASADGAVTITSPSTVTINSDLNVSGTINGQSSINAGTNVTAGYKVFATGGIETIGGMNIGFVSPGTSIASGIVTATNLVKGTVIEGITVLDHAGTMDLIRLIYNMHAHPDPQGGTTGTAVPPMIV